MPWNFPVGMFGREVAPALAAGNTVVLKPAEEAPISVLILAEIILEAGILPGTVNVITGIGPEAGAALASNPDINCLTFTGSVETGIKVMELAAKNITPISLELGGKNPMIVFPDANIETSIQSVIKGSFMNGGQVCSACSKLLLHADLYQKFLNNLVEKTNNLKIGPGMDDPDIGPLISEEQFRKVNNFINLGIEEGATLVTGGGIRDLSDLPDGFYVEPTIFCNVSPDMKIAKEEIFGPVLCVMRFETEEEALQIANNTCYGLVAGVFTSNLNIAHKFAKDIKSGQVYVNEWFAGGVETPFGGYKKSGFGRLKGLEGLRHYTQVKNICIKLEDN
jgi:acyl-CoA reductase-like NAD-dependent aldehyde dehydrogenase